MANQLRILWYIKPIDGRFPWKPEGRYPVDHHRIRRLADTIDRAGFYGALVTGTNKHDPWTHISTLIAVTERMRFLVPIHPGIIPPTLLAEEALTFDDYSNGRLLINQVNGSDEVLAWGGVHFPHDERYEVSEEYWTLFKKIYSGEFLGPYEGKYFKFGATPPPMAYNIPYGPVQLPYTPIWGSGASEAGIRHAGRVLDTYLTFLQRPALLKEQIRAAKASAAENGRKLRIGTYASIIVRETEEEAWAHAQWLLEKTGVQSQVDYIEENLRRQGKEGGIEALKSNDPQIQARIDALRAGKLPSRESLEVYPNIWYGVRGGVGAVDVTGKGNGTYIVGSAKQVANRIHELRDTLDIDTFIFSGWPLIDEAERTAELLLPLLDLDNDPPITAQRTG